MIRYCGSMFFSKRRASSLQPLLKNCTCEFTTPVTPGLRRNGLICMEKGRTPTLPADRPSDSLAETRTKYVYKLVRHGNRAD